MPSLSCCAPRKRLNRLQCDPPNGLTDLNIRDHAVRLAIGAGGISGPNGANPRRHRGFQPSPSLRLREIGAQEPEVADPMVLNLRIGAMTHVLPQRTGWLMANLLDDIAAELAGLPEPQSVRAERPGAVAAIDRCSQCAAVVSLVTPNTERAARPWLCGGCGSVYFAASGKASFGPHSGLARVAAYDEIINIATMDLASRNHRLPRAELTRLLRFFSEGPANVREKRKHKRYPMALPLVAVPLGSDFRVIGPATQITTINVSRGGASLLDTRLCIAKYLVLDFTLCGLDTAKAIFEVQRVKQILSAFEVAGRLLARIAD